VRRKLVCQVLVLSVLPSIAVCQRVALPAFEPVTVQQLRALEVNRFEAGEAVQGAAVDEGHFYAIQNTAIGKYDKRSGEFIARFAGPRDGSVRHMNSCLARGGNLLCANSNYPEVPMASSIEVFDTETMKHARSYSLGMLDEGSLTWFDRLGDGWIAGFAHFSRGGGRVRFKDQSFSSVVRYDADWRRIGGWMLPDEVISRVAPMSVSGGSLGPDGLLYLMGHDRPEMYVLAAPRMGPKLIHIATIEIDLQGQAFAWDRSVADRLVYGVDRPGRQVRVFRLPGVVVPDTVLPFTDVAVLAGTGVL